MTTLVPIAIGLARAGGGRQLTTTALAVVAFAVTSTFALSVLGGLHEFLRRAEAPASALMAELAPTYVVLV